MLNELNARVKIRHPLVRVEVLSGELDKTRSEPAISLLKDYLGYLHNMRIKIPFLRKCRLGVERLLLLASCYGIVLLSPL